MDHTTESGERNIGKSGLPTVLSDPTEVWELLKVVTILVPKFPLLKEWSYAGFFFAMSGAIFSHPAVGNEGIAYFGPTLLLALTVVSWYFRPENRKAGAVHL